MKKPFLLLIIFAVTQPFIAQHKYDIGISFSDQTIGYGGSNGNLNLEFRKKINDKWRLTTGLNFGGSALFYNTNQTFFDFSDSSITYRYSNFRYGDEFNVQLGLERSIISILSKPLKQKIISYSFDLLFGTKSFAIDKFNETTFFDSIYYMWAPVGWVVIQLILAFTQKGLIEIIILLIILMLVFNFKSKQIFLSILG